MTTKSVSGILCFLLLLAQTAESSSWKQVCKGDKDNSKCAFGIPWGETLTKQNFDSLCGKSPLLCRPKKISQVLQYSNGSGLVSNLYDISMDYSHELTTGPLPRRIFSTLYPDNFSQLFFGKPHYKKPTPGILSFNLVYYKRAEGNAVSELEYLVLIKDKKDNERLTGVVNLYPLPEGTDTKQFLSKALKKYGLPTAMLTGNEAGAHDEVYLFLNSKSTNEFINGFVFQDLGGSKLKVTSVISPSAAHLGGLKVGDIILEINGKAADPNLVKSSSNAKRSYVINRNGKTKKLAFSAMKNPNLSRPDLPNLVYIGIRKISLPNNKNQDVLEVGKVHKPVFNQVLQELLEEANRQVAAEKKEKKERKKREKKRVDSIGI